MKAKQPPRYTIRKDSLDRRYAIDKRSGKRVPLSKAEDERKKRRKQATLFYGITPVKKPKKVEQPKKVKPKKVKQQKLKAAPRSIKKGGWRPHPVAIPKQPRGWRPHPVYIAPLQPITPVLTKITEYTQEDVLAMGEAIGAFTIPKDERYVVAGGIGERSLIYPKVKEKADDALVDVQFDLLNRRKAEREGRPVPPAVPTSKFDSKFGPGRGQAIRDYVAGARDLFDVDQILEQMTEWPDFDIPLRELYTLYFSPE